MKSVKKKRGARLGQHFLTGEWAARALAEAVQIRAGETVLEIGPGKGALTKHLLETGGNVIAIEKDEKLAKDLEVIFPHEIASGRLIVLADDVRNFDAQRLNLGAGKYVLAANIPYYITGEIIRQFLSIAAQPRAMALLIQKEVADRIIARNHKESILSLSVKIFGTPRIIAKVSKGNFSPPPSVDSAILLVNDISKSAFADVSERDFFRVVKAGFSSKRKFLANNLANEFSKETVAHAFAQSELALNIRAEDVTIAQWLTITERLSST